MDTLDRVRESFAHVADNARHVRINAEALKALAAALPAQPVIHELDREHHLISTPEETAAYLLMLDSVNFGSGYKPFLTAEGWTPIEGSIYYGVSVRLKNWFERNGMPDADTVSRLDEAAVTGMFELPGQPYSRQLTQLFTRHLNAMGCYIEERHGGDWLGPVEAAGGRAAKLVDSLADIPEFSDTADYNDRTVSIFKRAQIAAADMHYAFRALGTDLFDDMDRLTMFADNAVPHVLRVDNVLSYDSDLAAHLDNGRILESGSQEEIEIRCCAGQAVEELARLKNLTSVQVDHMLWNIRFEDPRYKQSSFRPHRTLTACY